MSRRKMTFNTIKIPVEYTSTGDKDMIISYQRQQTHIVRSVYKREEITRFLSEHVCFLETIHVIEHLFCVLNKLVSSFEEIIYSFVLFSLLSAFK